MRRLPFSNINTKDFWDDQYLRRTYTDEQTRLVVVAQLIDNLKPKNVLDIGCGLGEVYGRLKIANTQCDYYGTDFSETAIKRCQEKFPEANWIVAEVDKQPFGDKEFDVVVSCEVLEHLENAWDLIKETKRLVKDNGTIIITTPRLFGVPSDEHLWMFDDYDMKVFFNEFKVSIVNPELLPRVIICQAQKLSS
jgi:2-polyprenyl-3-methyl-5-hydroxy-6-metoxy-1,4-benzoquinol methylase